MNYQETLDYLFSRLPMFQRNGPAALKPSLDNTIALCRAAGNPEKKFKSIHIAGTNGKGSVSHFIASACQENGLKTGLYTSPHLVDFRERIRINGEMIPEKEVIGFTERMKSEMESIEPSFFELTMVMAFDYFAREKVDVAIIETGLGGRLDSTNVIIPLLSVITNIGLDHTALLGNSLDKIAAEKAGIIKENIPVVIGEFQEETIPVFLEKARIKNAPVFLASANFRTNIMDPDPIPRSVPFKITHLVNGKSVYGKSGMNGLYQEKNLSTVWQSLELLSPQLKMDRERCLNGLEKVIVNTGLRGRWEKLGDKPLIITDTGHNEPGIRLAMEQLKKIARNMLHIVFGVVADKDPGSVLELLPEEASYYFCAADIPRAMKAEELATRAGEFGLSGAYYASVKEAIRAAKKAADPENDVIFIGGSIFVVGEGMASEDS